ncbi:MAG: hypothetical protein K9N23_07105 [Akkermansiaceae bacterium]|nr:hypothetical protein [Akkermansiaceae bacterium]
MKTGEEAIGVLLDVLNRLEVDYMVVGSFSSNRYGVPRATKDADLVLKIGAAERERLFATLPGDFRTDPQVTFEMVTGTWRQVIKVSRIPFIIELFELSADDFDQSRFSRRRRLTLLGRDAWLPTAEDVIVQKLRWCAIGRRSKDFDDAVAVMGVQGEAALDWTYIERWCRLHGTLRILDEAKAEAAPAWDDDSTQ